MASRRHPALPTLALAAALGATALATSTAAADHTAAPTAGTHSAKAFPSNVVAEQADWNSMVPEGGHPVQA